MASKNKKKCLEFSTANCDPSGIANNSSNFSDAYNSLGEYENDIDSCKKRLDRSTAIGDQSGIATNNGCLGHFYLKSGDYKNAIDYSKKSLEISTAIGNKSEIVNNNGNLGDAYFGLEQYETAIHYYKEGLKMSTAIASIGDKSRIPIINSNLVAIINSNLAKAYLTLRQYKKAIYYGEKALEISTAIGNMSGIAIANGDLGNAYMNLDEYKKAILYSEEGLEMSTAIGDKSEIAYNNHNLVQDYLGLGEYKKAIDYGKKCLEISTDIDDQSTIAASNNFLGNAYACLGEYKTAIDYHRKSLETNTAIGNASGIASVNGSLGSDYHSLGEYEKAISYHEKHLDISRAINDRSGMAMSNGNLGNAYQSSGKYKKAIDYHERSLEISTAIEDRPAVAASNSGLGNAYRCLGEYKKAIDYHRKSLEISTAINDQSGIAHDFVNIGNVYLCLGEYENAIHYYKKGLETNTAISLIARANGNLGCAYRYFRKYKVAASYLIKSIRFFDTIFLKSVPDQNKLSFTLQYFFHHQILMSCFISLERNECGLLVIDLGRAKELHCSIERRQDSLHTMFDYARAMWEKIENKEEQLEIESLQKILQVESNATSILVFAFDFENVLNVWVLNGEVIFRECKSGARLETFVRLINKFFRRVNVNVNRDSSFVKLDSVSNPDSQTILSLEMPRKRSEATNLVEKTTDGDNLDNETILKKLYQLLIEPFRDVIKGNKLIVVPDKQLFFVPFSALIDENSCRLSRSYNIQITPSLHTLKCSMERPHDSDFGFALLVGNPTVGKISLNGKIFTPSDLPFATEEVKCLSKRFEAHPFLGREATKQIVLEHLSRATIIHIAAHGEPKRGEIILATQPSSSVPEPESYLLTQIDILRTSLKARLVVLCCCHTRQGEISSEGVIGIARAFLAAGARSVLATLWPIEDLATKEFMDAFYDELFQETSVCEALSRAKNRFQKYDSIKIWAPFTIYGEDVMFQKHDIEKIREKSREMFSDFVVLP